MAEIAAKVGRRRNNEQDKRARLRKGEGNRGAVGSQAG
jgi:hypothetical protein